MTVFASASRWKDLPLRLTSAAVIAPVSAYCVVEGGVLFKVLLTLITFGLAYEGAHLAGLHWRVSAQRWRIILLLLWPVASLAAGMSDNWSAALTIVLAGFIFGPAQWLCVLSASLGSLSLLYLRDLPTIGVSVVAYLLVVVIACDSGAYVCGRLIGGQKLAPRISPGKTRSGAIGGLVFAGLSGLAIAWAIQHVPTWEAFFWALIIGVTAQCGDLLESAVKRRVGVKDSGRLLPGHGGLLDRLDGLILAALSAAVLSVGVKGEPFWTARWADIMTAVNYFLVNPHYFFSR